MMYINITTFSFHKTSSFTTLEVHTVLRGKYTTESLKSLQIQKLFLLFYKKWLVYDARLFLTLRVCTSLTNKDTTEVESLVH